MIFFSNFLFLLLKWRNVHQIVYEGTSFSINDLLRYLFLPFYLFFYTFLRLPLSSSSPAS